MKDELFFERIEQMRGRLYRIAYPYFNSESMAVDLVDEAIYQAYLKKRQLRREEYMETWIVRILINLCNTRYKKMKRQTNMEQIPEEVSHAEFDNFPLKEAMAKLPQPYREVVVLKYFGEYTIAEIGKMLDTPQGTIATRMRKALELLRLDMAE